MVASIFGIAPFVHLLETEQASVFAKINELQRSILESELQSLFSALGNVKSALPRKGQR